MARAVLATMVVATTVAAGVLPPSHIHLTPDHHHHHADVRGMEHAHWAAHDRHGVGVELVDDAARVLFIGHPWLSNGKQSPADPILAVTDRVGYSNPRPAVRGFVRPTAHAVRDGPPGQTFFLRGPPFVL